MRGKIVAGNWKMNTDHREAAQLAREIVEGLSRGALPCEVILIPPFTSIQAVAEAVSGHPVAIGGQDLWYEESGAFTGEISASMLLSAGCTHVLIGHSERRHIIGEQSQLLLKKARAALGSGLIPIFCVGETLEQRESGNAGNVVESQLVEVAGKLSREELSRMVIAYEPVWAIGTGRTASPADASEMHGHIRQVLAGLFDDSLSEETMVLYGGSVKPSNASELLGTPEIDGALVGGASLDADSFLGIIFPD